MMSRHGRVLSSASVCGKALLVCSPRYCKQGEVDAPVLAVLQEMRMLGEIIVLAMLQDKDAVMIQHLLVKDNVRNLWKLLQGIRGVSKDKVELLPARFQEAEHITSDVDAAVVMFSASPFSLQLLQALLNEPMVVAV